MKSIILITSIFILTSCKYTKDLNKKIESSLVNDVNQSIMDGFYKGVDTTGLKIYLVK